MWRPVFANGAALRHGAHEEIMTMEQQMSWDSQWAGGDWSSGQAGSPGCTRDYFDRAGLAGMLGQFEEYEGQFLSLAEKGGSVQDIRRLTGLLGQPFVLRGPCGEAEARLGDPVSVKNALTHAGQYDVHLEVRRIDLGLPAYYLSRVRKDYWEAYGLVVEDLYRSSRYPIDEPRFIRLMDAGRNTYFLRLSDFREPVSRMLGEERSAVRPRTDSLLYTLGRYVLQGAWHIDQRFAFMVAKAFDLPNLQEVIELSYFCLSCDLGALRRHLNGDVLRFFNDVYPNKALSSLIARLPHLNGSQFSALSQCALECYVDITALFNEFLRTTVQWQAPPSDETPLWKLILANMGRLPIISTPASLQESILAARTRLESGAATCIEQTLQVA
jgi:hypothetical protein